MSYSRYKIYKDSGIDWLGALPEDWELKKLKFHVTLINQKIEVDEESQRNYIGLENVISWKGVVIKNNENYIPDGISNTFESGNVLFGKLRPYLAKAFVASEGGICSSEFLVFRTKISIDKKFLLFSLLTDGFIKSVNSSTYGSKMPRASWDFIGNIYLPSPNIKEQQTIAKFLDKETNRIDKLIEKKQNLIDSLKEKRIAVISHAVTKGLNKDIRLRPSEIKWLGNIPEHWDEKALKYSCTINDKALAETTDPEYEINYVDIGSIDKTKGIVKKEQYLFDEAPSRARRIVQDGDILVSTVRTYLRAIAPVINPEENLIVSTGFAVVRPHKIDSDYLSFLLRSKYFVEKVVSLSVGVSYPAINASVLASVKIPIPPTEEQKKITQYLKKETESIDKIVGLTEKHIDKLKEYKTAIISAAVTGKIKVSE